MLVSENGEKFLELAPGYSGSSNYSLRAAATRAQHVTKVNEFTDNFHLAILHCDHGDWSADRECQ